MNINLWVPPFLTPMRLTVLEMRIFKASRGGMAANSPSLAEPPCCPRISLATYLERYTSVLSSPLLMSTHLALIGLRWVRLRQLAKGTVSHTPIFTSALISSILASITFSYFKSLPVRSS